MDWATRYDYLKGRAGVLFDILRWLLSPRGLDFLFIVALVVLLLAIILTVNSSAGDSRGTVIRKASSKEPASRVEILSPLDLWVVGWHRTVRGSVYPPDSRVQVLVRPPNDCWHVQDVEVVGGLWTCNCQFGEKDKPGMSYKLVAVHGESLKQKAYDDLPEGLVRSGIITVNRNSTFENKKGWKSQPLLSFTKTEISG